MSRERIIQEEILTSVMREMQKDFYDDKWWENKKVSGFISRGCKSREYF